MSYLAGNSPLSYRIGGVTPLRKMLGAVVVWSGMDADFSAYLAAGIANGSTMSASNQSAVNAFIVGCKADGVWTPIKASCLLCAWDSLAGALTPLVGSAPTNFGFVAGDYSRTTGLLGNGTSKYLAANRANNADPSTSKHLAVWRSASETRTATRCTLGAGGTSTAGYSQLLTTTTNRLFRVNGKESSIPDTTTIAGFFGATITSGVATGRYNGTNTALATGSVAPGSEPIYVYSRDPTVATRSDACQSFYSIGENLDLSLLDARLSTLMSALT